MPWNPTDREIERLIAAPAQTRYEYCLHKIADQSRVWSLKSVDGWGLMADDTNKECIPIWPHTAYATLCATKDFQGHLPESIPLEIFISRWIPGMEADHRLIVLFPTPKDRGVVVTPQKLLADLKEEMSKYS